MSETVHYKGRATKVVIPEGKTTEDVVKEILKEQGYTMESYHDDVFECLRDEDPEYFYDRKNDILYMFGGSI